MKEITGGVCAPKGFMAGGIRCGIKAGNSLKKDLALIYSQKCCNAAAVFTTNRVKAASVLVCMENIADGKLHAVIANSGNANACTGQTGMDNAKKMASLAAGVLKIDPSCVAVASTGVIGAPLPIGVIENNIGALKMSLRDDEQGHYDALEAIMTTDIRKKDIAVELEIGGKTVRIGAMSKGSGMIHPNMATMLAFITTDCVINKNALDAALKYAVKRSFNRLTVDGDTSTNDMALVMANGEAGNEPITIDNEQSAMKNVPKSDNADFNFFRDALEYVCVNLARKMARDGEGAAKLVTVTVRGAKNEDAAETLAKSVASSSLVKAACFGADANWGRVLCAMGYSGEEFSPEKTNASFKSKAGVIDVCKNGENVPFCEKTAKMILSQEEIEINIAINDGNGKASVWGCDLTYDYVKINGDYRS
ncbi:MAG: bifunctional glutamate N-acetyltransferase/amino-acid acetyltransferase ArgJ [Treponema sp.]|jgi:glutamate N-acetyltransferase/amino-acid N-acetyltransferase|nr:bifunctional glutamate N-acetyltransferase/amino-acid acetyltransferase ArgJ [Treponema sp.]